jgi:membrane protein required for colicin V production
MTILDWSIVAVVVLSVTLAAAQGFFFELFSLAGSVLGYVLAMWEYPRVASWFLPFVKAQPYANFAAFLTIFFFMLLLAGMIARLVRWAIHEAGLRWADRLLGGAFGLARGLVIVCVGVMAAAAFAPNSQTLARSQLALHPGLRRRNYGPRSGRERSRYAT